MAGPKTGLLDLEKELTCSICTDLLYQPLTLLDCLHTFCGSCLKEWFTSQASRVSGHASNPYTCPSCRSSVRETRPDAKVTTLLDMFVQANPASAKTSEEKEEIGQRYKPGEDVMPKAQQVAVEDDSDEEADRRIIEEIREMSLRDVGGRGPRSYERGIRHRNRSPDPREDDTRQRRRRNEDRVDRAEGRRSARSRGNDPAHSESRSQARQIEHQSSLRSLLSNSEVDSSEMEEEILRQIMDEGLLDGIDLNNIDVSQEDALSERIAEAYRRRHLPRSRSQDTRNGDTRGSSASVSPSARENPVRRRHIRSSSGTDRTFHDATHSSHPPVSRPHLLEAYPVHQGHRHRTLSESRRQTSPVAVSPTTQRQAARSATDLSDRPRTTEVRNGRPSDLMSRGRTSTDPHPRPLNHIGHLNQGLESREISRRHDSPLVPVESTVQNTPSTSTISHHTSENVVPRPVNTGMDVARLTHPLIIEAPRSELFSEPSITCERCGKQNIEYDLHANCFICENGNYNICRSCYRSGLGCLHWYGFGHAAWHRFHSTTSKRQDLPHVLIQRKYLRPKSVSVIQVENDGRRMTAENPSFRLQSGAFCSICSVFANDVYWKCESCNDGEWGFCNACVNTGKCCTHPLLPIAHVSTLQKNKDLEGRSKQHVVASFAPITSPHMPEILSAPNSALIGQYRPLNFATNCNICKYPVQPSQTRFHCYECNKGDYDICTASYLMLVANGHISRENGDKGWRRCPKGHRMVIIGFEDSPVGQSRVIVKDLVGGHSLKDEVREAAVSSQEPSWRTRTVSYQGSGNNDGASTSTVPLLLQKFPPDGGAGMRVLANWSYWPQDGATDELGFPRGAEIREVEDVNGDWFWGSYAGVKGLFPGPYVKMLGS